MRDITETATSLLDDYFHGDTPEISELTHDQRLTVLVELEGLRAWIDAVSIRTLAYMADHPEPLPVAKSHSQAGEFLRDEIALATGLPFGAVHQRITIAQTLTHTLPVTLGLLEDQRLTYPKAAHLAKAVKDCDPAVATDIEARVLTRATEQNLPAFQKSVSRAVIALDPADRHEQAKKDRAVSSRNLDDAMALIQAVVPAVDKVTIMAAIQTVADGYAKDDRTADQKRADALADICAAVLNGDLSTLTCGTKQGRKVSVELVVPLSAILGHDDHPAELPGYGPIPAHIARALAFDDQATWRTLITTDAGYLLDYGRTTYTPPQALKDYVIARDRTCAVPGCQRHARHCDIDHRTPWDNGGATSADNTEPLCQHHHKMKHNGGWTLARTTDRSYTWTAPTGRTYTKPPTEQPL